MADDPYGLSTDAAIALGIDQTMWGVPIDPIDFAKWTAAGRPHLDPVLEQQAAEAKARKTAEAGANTGPNGAGE